MSREFSIGRHTVGLNYPTYFIADIAANHDGSLERARDLIRLAAEAGADAVKFQNFRAETIVSDFGFRALGGQRSHQSSWKKSIFEIYDAASLPMDWTATLKDTSDSVNIDYFTAPYDPALLDLLSEHVCAWKVGSGDITWIEFIEAMARYKFPMLIATGAADLTDVRRAIGAIRKHEDRIVLMQCNTNYTASLENFHHIALNALKVFQREYPQVVLGLSDHTPGDVTVLGAVALGARVIEKHFTDDCDREGPDHAFSMSPRAWRKMVDRTRSLEAALGPEVKRIMDNEADTVVLQRRAVRAARAIPRGTSIAAADLTPLRPCPPDALPPYRMCEVIGRTAMRDIPLGECVRLADVS